MQLFIIGNGFDKAHKLKTAYWDFRKFLETNYLNFLTSFEENYDLYPESSENGKKDLLWNEFETNLANIKEDELIDTATSIDMGLEGGDIGVEDTLNQYFGEQLGYIKQLPLYLKYWIRSIRIKGIAPRTNIIDSKSEDIYVNFNYTSVLENVYDIDENNIVHIHGSLRERYGDPVIGHGNYNKIKYITEMYEQAHEDFEEKKASICHALISYYNNTYKNTSKYTYKLQILNNRNIDKIFVVGHSLSDIDMLYFYYINHYTKRKAIWYVYWHEKDKKDKMLKNLIDNGISRKQIKMINDIEFFNLNKDDK